MTITNEQLINLIESIPDKYFGDLVTTNEVSDGKSYRCAADEPCGEIFPGDLIPKDMLVGPDGIQAYKTRPEKKQEFINEIRR